MLRRAAQTLVQLPRETRDTFFMLAVIGWVVLLQVGHIPWWCTLLSGAVLAARATLALRGQPLPGWSWRAALLALTLGATWLTHDSLLGRDAGVTLIVALLALKTLELRARRDAFVVFFLAFFTLLTHFFYSQSLLSAIGTVLAVLGLLTALVNAHLPVGRPPLAQSARIAAGMALLGAPLMLVLFLLFPRMEPLWSLPSDGMSGRSGLSEQMRVGQIARLALDERIALRIRFDGAPPAPEYLYLRGPVLGDFDGTEWRALRSSLPASMALTADLRVTGAALHYEVTLEPHLRPWLFVLEATPQAPLLAGHEAFMSSDLQWHTRRPISELLRYRAVSYPHFAHGPLRLVPALHEHTRLPPGYNPRTLALAQTLRQQHGFGSQANPALVQAVLERLRSGGYSYTLEPGLFGPHSADEFWFDRREGFCEHIASAFVLLMRALDIPARIVTGYLGGELNPVDGFWTVRQSDAHAWAEVWLRDQGWVRVDPTASVAPQRIGTLQRLRAPEGALAGAIRTLNPTLATQLRALWEAANNRWNQWVLKHNRERQFDLLKSLGFASPSWADLAKLLIALVLLLGLAGAAWTLWQRQQHDPWLRLLQRSRQRLQGHGLAPGAHLPPRALAQQVQQHFGDNEFSRSLCRWLLRLEAQRYSAHSSIELATLRSEYRQIVWPSKNTR
ncbi:DUF3488 and transglutaminase-like domain-containing protein [Hydrogenophaga sp.]|uniref:transglutaminase family protein n=1 Tax=Hydrogenophaga sp. TaxID=1904254 RepID=UPI001989324A|nr:DUF3488 and transglutaminase-like domain-containing protein [Hydrogenophaga sp.]MBD3892524.1 DUF3488 domain-containing protein [Hydrogenophaga sp.]